MKRMTCVLCATLLGCAPEFNPDLSDLASEGTEGSDSGDDSTGTETSSSTSEGDTTQGTGDGDGDTGSTDETSTTGDGDTGGLEPLNPGDLCHPFNAILDNMPACPPVTHCKYTGFNQTDQKYEWKCELAEGEGAFLDECGPTYNSNSCGDGLICSPQSGFVEGTCTTGYCCAEFCDVLSPACNGGFECVSISNETNDYPDFFSDTEIPYIGWCVKP